MICCSIQCDRSGDWPGDGTCFRVAEGILTAGHCFGELTECVIDHRFEARLIRTWLWPEGPDVALVRGARPPELQILGLSTRTPDIGEVLTWYGTDDNWQEESCPVIVRQASGLLLAIEWRHKMGPGDSGGPILDASGLVVGMTIQRGRSGGKPVLIALAGPTIARLLGEYAQDEEVFGGE